MTTDVHVVETKPERVEAMQFDGTVETAQAILEWANSDDLRAVLRGTTVFLETLINNVPQILIPEIWVVKSDDGDLAYYSPEAYEERFQEATGG